VTSSELERTATIMTAEKMCELRRRMVHAYDRAWWDRSRALDAGPAHGWVMGISMLNMAWCVKWEKWSRRMVELMRAS
jgi:hypothetical protein